MAIDGSPLTSQVMQSDRQVAKAGCKICPIDIGMRRNRHVDYGVVRCFAERLPRQSLLQAIDSISIRLHMLMVSEASP